MIMELDFVANGILEEDPVEVDENNENSNFEGERCGICMDIIIDRGVLDCCQHWFCFDCIDNWASITNLCPLCQNEFQLITCVPVYDTIGNNKVDEDSLSRDDDWSIEGRSNTLSFPSYYIDENAVICLDGDGCKIRSGLATVEEDSNLDTSIACDSCDIWYHAFCVGFNPDDASEDTWLCPRCRVDEAPEKSDVPLIQSFHVSPSTNSAFSGKLTVSIADAGETAVVVSMVGENEWTKEPSENSHPSIEVDKNLKVDEVSLDCNNLHAETSSSGRNENQQVSEAHGLELSLSRHTSFSQPQSSNSLVLNELDASCSDEPMNEPSKSDCVKDSLRKFNVGNNESESESSVGLHLGLSVGCSWSVDPMKNNKIEDQVTSEVQQQSLSDESLLGDKKILTDDNKEAVTIIGMKRKHKDCSDDSGEANAKNEDEEISKKTRVEGTFKMTQFKDQGNTILPDDSQKCPTQITVLKDVKQSSEKEDVTSDVMSIVQGTGRRSSKNPANISSKEKENLAGLRVKKIMKRAPEDKDSSIVVQKLKKEIRDAVRNKSSADIGENLFDPKLLTAFRAAVAGTTTEPSAKLPPSALKVKRALLQKGKIRENLTKKIYGDPNGRRRRAWDRECEIEFWKYRCTRASKPEKIATLKSVLTLLRKDPSVEGLETEKASECHPILSRLYLADTSVFPRKNDIKPISALTPPVNPEQRGSQHISVSKGLKTSPEDHTIAETNKSSLKPGVSSVCDKGSQNKVSNSKSRVTANKIHPDRASERSSASPLGSSKVIDKRKWALEVLARKKAAAGKTATHEQQEETAALKGNFPLMAQLPADMRPVLAASSHNKIPVSVRQTQLYRLTEHFLKKADLPEICRTAETELAVADAINIEREVADKSNSKVVYLNLCSQEILRHSNNGKSLRVLESNSSPPSVVLEDGPPVQSHDELPTEQSHDKLPTEQSHDELPTDPAVMDALRNAGLLSDSPPNSPCHGMEVPVEQINDAGPDNVFEINSYPDVDIYGDFEYDLEDEDFIGATTLKVSKLPPSEENELRMKVVFSTLKSERSNDLQEIEDNGNVKDFKDSPSLRNDVDTGIISSNMEQGTDESRVKPESLLREEVEELSLAECEELYGPDKEPLINRFPEASMNKLYGENEALSENNAPGENENCQSENMIVAPHNQRSCNEENSSCHSETSEKIHGKDKSDADNKKQRDTVKSVSNKVETYIKEHIRPLCKSGVITPEQYRWAVAKTTEKVMKYHVKDKNANFLIKEGDKVKKLAQQYVEAAQQKGKK